MKNQLAEIREYCLFWPGQATQKATTTQAIFYKGLMTNFWRDKNPTDSGFHINQSEEELQKWCELINERKVKPSEFDRECFKKEQVTFDRCSFTNFKPKKLFFEAINTANFEEQQERWGIYPKGQGKNPFVHVSYICSRSGYSIANEDEVREKLPESFLTQYTHIFNKERLQLMDNAIIFWGHHGYFVYATPLNEIPTNQNP